MDPMDKKLLSSAKTAVILNGVPGNWIDLKRGLRQGDPLSPLLFLLVVDVLQQLIRNFAMAGDLKHPIFPNQPCPVLQYADDTLIVMQADLTQAKLLREILDAFARFSGLKINFTKSTFVSINLSKEESLEISSILSCPVATFPQLT